MHTPVSRSRRAPLLAVLGLAVLVLAGCNQDNRPQAYDDTTRANFVQGCTGEGTDTTLAATDYCECAYQYFVDNVPFDAEAARQAGLPEQPNFVQINEDLVGDDQVMPADIQQAIADECGGPAPPSGGPTTTAATDTSQAQ